MKNLGSVVELKFPGFFVYGICCEVDDRSGDSLAMLSQKFESQIDNIEELSSLPVRYKQRFFVRHARSKRFSDVCRVVGKMNMASVPKVDPRYRLCLAGLSASKGWQTIDQGNRREVVDTLTKETAMLSDDGLRGLELIQSIYDEDLYPWSSKLTSRGSTNFDPVTFEADMRKACF